MHSFKKLMQFSIVAGVFYALVLIIPGCSPKTHDALLATIGRDTIPLSEYERLYVKSNGSREAGVAANLEDRQRFLDLMVKYRLKLADAYRQGLNKKPEVLGEIQQYKGSLAASFLTEREIVSPGIKHLFDIRKEELRCSHILISLAAGASAAESTAAYKKAYDLINQLRNGADFGVLALANSADPSAKQNKGDLYYFTGGQMVPSFEEAAYALKVGEFTTVPVRSQFGLHIIKLTDRKPAPGEVKCSHIMIRFSNPNPSPEDTLAAFQKVKAIQDSLAKGIDFADLARRNSGDAGSASRGGDLGWFTRRRWVQSFDEVALTLKAGQVSGIVRTPYGYHLIKCYETRPPKTFEEGKQETQQLYQQTRFQEDYSAYLAKLKKELRFSVNDSIATRLLAALDSNKTTHDSAWSSGISPSLGNAALMTMSGRSISIDSVVAMIKTRPDLSNISLRRSAFQPALDKVSEQLVLSAKADELERSNAEFASILKEYREGIILYQIEQDRVWNKVTANDSLLHIFFAAHRDKFVYPDRVVFTEMRMPTEIVATEMYGEIKKGKTFEQIARADSLRLKEPSAFHAPFPKGATAPGAAGVKVLTTIAGALQKDPSLKVQLIAYADTSAKKRSAQALAKKRLESMTSMLSKKFGIAADRIATFTRPPTNEATDPSPVDLELIGRQPKVMGIETSILAPGSDERAQRADSLSPGGVTSPFFYKVGYSIVRLDGREKSREKTFEEAGSEISSTYQDFESKRLESEWLDGLRKEYPVVENKEVLKDAFAPTK